MYQTGRDGPWTPAREGLDETSEELLAALGQAVGAALDREPVRTEALHTGGGIMVAAVDLSIDGRFMGRQLWLTREEGWTLGMYDYYADEDDHGVCVRLLLSPAQLDSPQAVADEVAAILVRLGVTGLQGE